LRIHTSRCREYAVSCPESRLDGGLQKCLQVASVLESIDGSSGSLENFVEITGSVRTCCYARSMVEHGGADWGALLDASGIGPDQRRRSCTRVP